MMELSEEYVDRYIGITEKALQKVRIIAPEPSYVRKMAEDFLNMAQSYYKDALHFREKGDLINAFAAVNYAHGWLDAGARLGFFEVGGDWKLFTLSE